MIKNETLSVIKNRRSIRAYKEEQITDEELQAVLEAGLYAPSAMNQQCWHFTILQNKEIMDEISKSAKLVAKTFENEHLQKLANNEKFHIYYGAPTVIIISGEEKALMSDVDCAAATENMLLAAEAIELGACWINFTRFAFASDKGEHYRKTLAIPEGYSPFYSITLGYKKVETLNAPPRKENIVNYVK